MSTRILQSVLVAATLGAASCAGVPTLGAFLPFGGGDPAPNVRDAAAGPTEANDRLAGWSAPAPSAVEPVLYGRDGTPIGRTQPGEVVRTNQPLDGGVDQNGGTRGVLLELYNEVVKERNELLDEVLALSAQAEHDAGRIAELEQRSASLDAQATALTARNEELEAQVLDLAARLTQAQIGRLEAERALLEASLEWRRMNAGNNATEGGTQ